MDIAPYQGIGQFGPAYRAMLENDAHAPGSVDRVLMEGMVALRPETVDHLCSGFTPAEVCYLPGSRLELERSARLAIKGRRNLEERIEGIAEFCASLGDNLVGGLDALVFGGTEEEIIPRGTDNCLDTARVACALAQVVGLPARLVYLADTDAAYSGHAIIEVYRGGLWGAADPAAGVVYRQPDSRPASTWQLMNRPALVQAHAKGGATPYTRPGQFRAAAVANYFIWESDQYDYTARPVNAYCRTILEMSARGWPGGLRWLHGEDAAR